MEYDDETEKKFTNLQTVQLSDVAFASGTTVVSGSFTQQPLLESNENIEIKRHKKKKKKHKYKLSVPIRSPESTYESDAEDDRLEPLADISGSDECVNLSSPQTSEDSKDLECGYCGKTFVSKKLYKRHVLETHNTNRPYACDICNKRYKRPYDIKVHKELHTNKKQLSCDMCDFTSSYSSAINNHRKRHTQNSKYSCDLCGKGFTVRTWWKEHVNYHTGAKPFKCNVCDKAFMYSRYLTAHKKEMHSALNGCRPVNRCPFCDQLFSYKKSLQHHMKSHTEESVKCLCDICGKELSSPDHLKVHKRIHTGEKPYMCSMCGKAFTKKCNLVNHERIHTGERPYTCEQCNKGFTQLSALVIHLRYHTGQRPYKCPHCDKGFVSKYFLTTHQKSCAANQT